MSKLPQFIDGNVLEHQIETERWVEAKGGWKRDRYAQFYDEFIGAGTIISGATLVGHTRGGMTVTKTSGGTDTNSVLYRNGGPGVLSLLHSSTDEFQTQRVDFGNSFPMNLADGPVVEFRAAISLGTGTAFSADQRAVIGLGGLTDDTLDLMFPAAWFRMDGANNNIYYEYNDGTTNVDLAATGQVYADGTFRVYKIDCSALSRTQLSIDNRVVATVNFSGALVTDANASVQPYACIQKDAGPEPATLLVDYVKFSSRRHATTLWV